MDFFKYRFGPCMHLLQSARHAVKADLPEKMVLACLLHDISTIGFIRGDHGYWGAQLVENFRFLAAKPHLPLGQTTLLDKRRHKRS
jgi:predicted HD phosphohydrolase